ncbi:MAG: 4-hydroxy-2-oxovalerate aldolase [Planctomycetota bacterium]|nr:MAG: 4-hydroxy-2-oxovalerate aldolase [Planctomycetota bacterium]
MRRSRVLERWRGGRPVRLCSMGHYIPAFVGLAARAGFDAIWIDMEHRLLTDREVQALCAYGHRADIDCMVRPRTTERARLYRYLEDGASGLMIPHVSTVEQARALVDACKFPPVGNRGLDGAGFDGDFYRHTTDAYVEWALRETFLVVQIETPQAVDAAEAIAAVEGVDGLFIGTADLSLRIARTPGGDRWSLETAIEAVASAAARHGKAWGLPAATEADLRRFAEMGARLIAFGNDFVALQEMLRKAGHTLARVYGDAAGEG